MNKEQFLKEEFVINLKKIDLKAKPVFGKMNPHQMIEHMSHAFQIGSGKIVFENKQTEELTKKMYQFMMSDRPFKDNTPNPNIGSEPLPPRYSNVHDSLEDLENEIKYFFQFFNSNPDQRVSNPFFGNLNREEQVHLLHKHALHHLRQFNIILT